MTDLADYLLPKPPLDRDSWRWATVTAVSPLRVRLDGDSTPLALTPDALGPVRVGDRVWCQMVGRRVVVHQRSGAPVAMAAGETSVAAQTVTAGGFSTGVTVTFPVGRFTATPIPGVGVGSVQGGSASLVPKHSGVSTSGMTAWVSNPGAGSAVLSSALPLTWTAVQMTPTSGAG